MERRKNRTLLLVLCFISFSLIFWPFPQAKAVSLFTPFGGKIVQYSDDDPGCSAFTGAISAATAGVVRITVPAISIDDVRTNSEKKYGMLRIKICLSFLPACYTVPLNFLPTVYRHEKYKIPQVQTLGISFELCNLCDKLGELLPGSEFYNLASTFCKTEGIKQVIQFGCETIGSQCAATNLMIKLGTGLTPDTGN